MWSNSIAWPAISLLKVVVEDMATYDRFYRRLIEAVDLLDVSASFSMEVIKSTTELPRATAYKRPGGAGMAFPLRGSGHVPSWRLAAAQGGLSRRKEKRFSLRRHNENAIFISGDSNTVILQRFSLGRRRTILIVPSARER